MHDTADGKMGDNSILQLSMLELCLILLIVTWYMWIYTHQFKFVHMDQADI